ncbi:Sgo0707 family adhesin, partial [Parvimonas sp. M20]|uniref:Sgo0707 family adhesin n=2 Tax=unclassified Parvimonas TaxID=1151464 RepID=UPI002B494DBA
MKQKISKRIMSLFMMICMVFQVFISSVTTEAAPGAKPEVSHTDLDLSKLDLYEFKCRQENMKVIHMSQSVLKKHVVPNGNWKESTVFMHKFNRTPHQQNFNDVLELLFTDAGRINGKKVNVRVKVNRLQLNPTQYYGKQDNFNNENAGVPFLTVDQNWGDSGIQLMDYVYPDHPNFNDNNEQGFNTKTNCTVTLEYDDGTPCDVKLTMVPTDIDVKPGNTIANNHKTTFYECMLVENYTQTIDKLVYNEQYDLIEYDEGAWHYWRPKSTISSQGTSGPDEFNKTGFVMRSVNNKVSFGFNTAATSGGLFKFFAEVPYYNNPEKTPKKVVDRQEAPKRIGEPINYTVTYTVPRPGVDIIDDIKTLKFTDQFDKKVDFKSAQVKLDGKILTENVDYKLTKVEAQGVPPTIEIDIINKSLFSRDKAGKVYEIVYNTETNEKALVNGDDKVINSTARMYFDGIPAFANTVETKLIPPTPTKPQKEVYTGESTVNIDGKTVNPEQELTYAIKYTNTKYTEVDATITDKLPNHTSFVSADNNGTFENGTVKWNKKIAPGETWTVTFKVKIDKEVNGEVIKNHATVNDGENSYDTNETTNPTATKPVKDVFNSQDTNTSIDGKEVKAKDELLYKITYKNTTGQVQKVVIKDKIPAHTTFVKGSATNNGVFKDGEITWTKENVANGETVVVTFKVKVDDNVNGDKILNKANVADGNNNFDTNETTNPTATKPVKSVFNSKDTNTSIDGKEVKAKDELLYKITYKNTTGQVQKVVIKDKIPAHTTYVENSADNGGTFANGEITWTKENVADGETVEVTFKVKVDENVNGQKILNKANVVDGSNNFDTNETTNPTATKPVKDVFSPKDTKTSIDGKEAKAKDELLYKITYKNTTGKEQKVVIKDKIPEHTTYVEGSATNNGVFKDGEITWTKENVANGETVVVTFKVKVDDNVNGDKIVNKANVVDGSNTFDTNETTNPTATKPVKDVFDSKDDKTSIDSNEVKAGQELLYKITYKNTTGKVQKVVIKDKIPAHTSYVENSADNDGT